MDPSLLEWKTNGTQLGKFKNGRAIHLTENVKEYIDEFISDRRADIDRSENAQWLFRTFQVAREQAGLSLQTLSDHLSYIRNLRDNESMCIRGYSEGSSRFNHAHRPGFDIRHVYNVLGYSSVIRGHNVRRLNQIIMAAPSLDAPATVFRIANASNLDFEWFCSRLGMVVRPWHDQLVSSSFSGFNEHFEGIRFVISLPVGTCGLALLDPTMIRYLDDHEFLLPVHTEYQITGCELNASGRPVVHLRLIGPTKEPTPSGYIIQPPNVAKLPPLTYQDLRDYMLETFYSEQL